MTTLDPSTGLPLPDSAIQRVLYTAQNVHIYQIPPLTSTRGFNAGSWTAPPRPTARDIFTARLRVIETSFSGDSTSPSASAAAASLKTDILLEDPDSGALFAAAPYTTDAVVQQALDSSRFFAVRVQGEGGMKATLGIGFEERGDAFDFCVTLGEVRKVLAGGAGGGQQGKGGKAKGGQEEKEERRDFSLGVGESIHVQFGGEGRRVRDEGQREAESGSGAALFSIKPPPSGVLGVLPMLSPPPPPPSLRQQEQEEQQQQQHTQTSTSASSHAPQPSAQDLGFDDGEFGEFQ